MTDLLDEKRSEIDARLQELRPLVEEYQRLEAATAALAEISPSSGSPSQTTRPPARAAKRKSNGASSGRRRGRPKGSGKRGDEALALVTAQPGITIAEMAQRMGIQQNYLYRLLPSLANEGRVKKGVSWRLSGSLSA